MTVTIDGTTGVSLVQDGVITAADLASSVDLGKVLQIVEGTTSTQVNATTSSYVDTGLSVAITPSSTSSKILVVFNQHITLDRDSTTAQGNIILYRDSTAILTFGGDTPGIVVNGSSSVKWKGLMTFMKLDSPSTTSAITYKTQGRPDNTADNGVVRFQNSSRPSHAIAVEIAG